MNIRTGFVVKIWILNSKECISHLTTFGCEFVVLLVEEVLWWEVETGAWLDTVIVFVRLCVVELLLLAGVLWWLLLDLAENYKFHSHLLFIYIFSSTFQIFDLIESECEYKKKSGCLVIRQFKFPWGFPVTKSVGKNAIFFLPKKIFL